MERLFATPTTRPVFPVKSDIGGYFYHGVPMPNGEWQMPEIQHSPLSIDIALFHSRREQLSGELRHDRVVRIHDVGDTRMTRLRHDLVRFHLVEAVLLDEPL